MLRLICGTKLNYFVSNAIERNKNINSERTSEHTTDHKRVIYKNVSRKIVDKQKANKIMTDVSTLVKEKNTLTDEINLINEVIKEPNRQRLLKEVIELEKRKESLTETNKKLSESVNKLSFQKEMLINELENLKGEKDALTKVPLSIEYIDNLSDGLEFEKCFASMLKRLKFTEIEVTSGSGDFGIDVLAKKEGVSYGFQCKLYNGSVGNDAVQQAFSGKNHYGCNIAIVVTNNTFTSQAKKQALETQIVLWDRKILMRKIKEINTELYE